MAEEEKGNLDFLFDDIITSISQIETREDLRYVQGIIFALDRLKLIDGEQKVDLHNAAYDALHRAEEREN